MPKLRAGVLALLIALGGCAPLPREFYKVSGVQSIDHGQMLGVSIGMRRGDARAALLRHPSSRFLSSETCRDYPASHQMCEGATETDHYRIEGAFGVGLIDLQVRDDHIVRIIWTRSGYELI